MIKKSIAILLSLVVLLSLVGCSNGEKSEKSYSVVEYRTTMQYYDDFKLLQLTDLHLGIQSNLAHQLQIISDAIRAETPDLIILTGDSFMYASREIVNALIETLNSECASLSAMRPERITKFTITFGNHDNQGDYPRYYINSVMQEYTTSDGNELNDGKFGAFIDYEDDDLFGLANFYIDLVDDTTKSIDDQDVKYRLHVIDSNTYHFMGLDYDYDVIHDEQLDHTVNIYQTATKDKDYIGMAFFHIPLYEYEDAIENYTQSSDPDSMGKGDYREVVFYPYENNGSYNKLRNANIVAFFCGHDHINHGDLIFSNNSTDRAILSYGVKTTNQLYHEKDVMGYKTVVLKDISAEEFVSIENINENFKNNTEGYKNYED